MNNSEINIIDLLSEAPVGTPLYSPLMGECFLSEANKMQDYICVEDTEHELWLFNGDGRSNHKGECLLFPSANVRDWHDFSPRTSSRYLHIGCAALIALVVLGVAIISALCYFISTLPNNLKWAAIIAVTGAVVLMIVYINRATKDKTR